MGVKILWHLLVTCFPHELIERRVTIKWFNGLYCIVSHNIQCTNGKLRYFLVNKMGTTLTEKKRIKLYYFWLGSHVLLTKSNLSDQYFFDCPRCHTLVTGYHPHWKPWCTGQWLGLILEPSSYKIFNIKQHSSDVVTFSFSSKTEASRALTLVI